MKYIIFVIDGAGDYPVEELGDKTPLMAARKPNIDSIAKKGRCGLFRTIPDNFDTCSTVANLSIFGYDPLKYFQGRGVFEAAAMGIKLADEDVAFRCNTICVKNNSIKNHSAGHISNRESRILIQRLDKQLGSDRIKFYPGVSYRHLLVLRGYSKKVICSPPHDHQGEDIRGLLPKAKEKEAEETTLVLRRLMTDSAAILQNHMVNINRVKEGKDPANMIWPWSPGRKPKMKTYQELYGIKGAVISAVDLIKGIGIYAGFDVIKVEGATGLHDTNYEGKADACIQALNDHDIVYVHVEGIDEAGHEGNAKLKVKCIEDFDKRLLGRVLENVELSQCSIAILPDHLTPVSIKSHIPSPVPFAIYKPGANPDSVSFFDEESCKKGSYGQLTGANFISNLLMKE